MKKINIILILTIFSFSCEKSNNEIKKSFEKTYGGKGEEYGSSVIINNDSEIFIVGSTSSYGYSNYDGDVFLIKTDKYGNKKWIKTYGGIGYDSGESIVKSSDNGFIIVGYTNSFGVGKNDVYLIKTDLYGDTLWTKTIGGAYDDIGLSIKETSDNGYIITGMTYSYGNGCEDIYLIKLNEKGNVQWTKMYGSEYTERGNDVIETSDNGYIIAGYKKGIGAFSYDIFVVRTNSNGDTLWTKVFGGDQVDKAYSITQTNDNGFVIAGYSNSFNSSLQMDYYILKIDANGNMLWEKTFGGENDDEAYSIQQTLDNAFIITGTTESNGNGGEDVLLIKTDTDGNLLWEKYFGGINDEKSSTVLEIKEDVYIIVGSKEDSDSGDRNVYLIKYKYN